MKHSVKHFAHISTEPTALEQKNREIAYRAALEGIVLLENDGVLPLSLGPVALFGVGADLTIKGGTGSGEVNSRHAVSIMEGLEQAGFTVTTKDWINRYAHIYADGEAAYEREFKRRLLHLDIANIMNSPYSHPAGPAITEEEIKASGTDTCIYVVTRQAGEGADRRLGNGDNSLYPQELADLTLCAARYDKLILIINTGSTFDLSFLDEIPGIRATVFFAQQGDMGGLALADLLSGAKTPSGKLASSWVRRYDDVPFSQEYSYLNGNLDEEYYKEGIYVGYRYYDTFGVAPRYPFGFGLSYTDFSIVPGTIWAVGSRIMLDVTVTNVGACHCGSEIVQLYVSCPHSPALPKAYQQLTAFAKTQALRPGEHQTLTLSFDMSDLHAYREADASSVLDEGDYILRLGNSSRNTVICGVITLEETVVLTRHKHLCAPTKPIDEILAPAPAFAGTHEAVPHLSLDPAVFSETVTHWYHLPAANKNDVLLDRLTEEEWIELCVGDGMPQLKQSNKRYIEAPGTVGLTTPHLQHKGIPNVCLADGPAGLRLLKTSALTKSGKIKQIDPAMQLMAYLPAIAKKFLFGNPKRDTVVYQYTTAFPVELALAQTWNLSLLEEIGRAVSAEMTAYGITYWLAPAMNIHRNPLCGRNFEYFSEDPYLTGKLAAAITRGVQSEPGNFVTIKHFACNNQEDNRNRTNANVSERALREIYLRGFEIAVREAKPGAVMTSYNKLNGLYTPNNRDLVTHMLRGEWGFTGLVMTDWMSTGKGLADVAAAISAGNDLIMPGNNGEKRALKKALQTGALSCDDLRTCAGRILDGVRASKVWDMWKNEKGGC